MGSKLCEAAINGSVDSLDVILGEGRQIVDEFVPGCFTPLHVAISRGHVQFVKKLLDHNPDVAEFLDSRQRSALHVASAQGSVEIVRKLVVVSPEMCLALDLGGMNPLHVAAVNGKAEVLDVLIGASPTAGLVRVERDETILHLCVKHNQPRSLEVLLEKFRSPEFVNAKDKDGNTILHLAVADKNLEIVEYVLKNSKIDANAKNASEHTAMDILFLGRTPGARLEELDITIEDFLRQANAKRGRDLLRCEWVDEKRSALMVVASLMATMAFSAVVNPPGGVWQSDSTAYKAGEAVMAYNYAHTYPYFLRSNTVGFVASLSTILLLISGLPLKNRGLVLFLVAIMWLTVTAMAVTYAISITVITPVRTREPLRHTIAAGVLVWCSVMALLLAVHTVRMTANVLEERRSRNESVGRIDGRRKPKRSPNPNSVNGSSNGVDPQGRPRRRPSPNSANNDCTPIRVSV